MHMHIHLLKYVCKYVYMNIFRHIYIQIHVDMSVCLLNHMLFIPSLETISRDVNLSSCVIEIGPQLIGQYYIAQGENSGCKKS